MSDAASILEADYDLSFAQSGEGVAQSEQVAAQFMDGFVEAVSAVQLDHVITSTLLVAELLAAVKVHAGIEPEALIAQFRHLIDQRVDAMIGGDTGQEGCCTCGLDMPAGAFPLSSTPH